MQSTIPISQPPTALQSPPPAAQASTSSQPSAPGSTLRTLDARPDSRYVSQMPDVFSTEWGVQQSLVASKRKREAETLENSRRVTMQVTVHAQITVHHAIHQYICPVTNTCHQDGEDPVVSEMQDGFVPPYLKLTEAILVDAGFNHDVTHLLVCNAQYGTFVRVKVGHVLTVKEGEHVFLKAIGIVDCTVFNKQCETFGTKLSRPLHFRNNLPAECEYICDALLTKKLHMLTPSTRTHSSHLPLRTSSTSEYTKPLLLPVVSSSSLNRRSKANRKRKQASAGIDTSDDSESTVPRAPKQHKVSLSTVKQCHRERSTHSQSSQSSTFSTPFSGYTNTDYPTFVKHEPDETEAYTAMSGAGSSLHCAIDVDDEEEVDELVGDSNDEHINSRAEESDDDEVEVSKIWPAEFYTADIVQGFKAIADYVKHGALIKDAF